MEVKVLLNSIEKIKDFVTIARGIDCDIDLISGRHTYLDAKSIMGILSCNVTKPLTLDIHSDDIDVAKIVEKFAAYIYDEDELELVDAKVS